MWKGHGHVLIATMVKEITYNDNQMSDDNSSLQWMWLDFRNHFTDNCLVFEG